ncbi:MAG: deoxyguanosinetriphosphate triphosphohydrolase [Acetobacterium sp.]
MEWEKLLTDTRLGKKINPPYDPVKYYMSEFEKDYWRIINSASFRRLQDKTQVFPLDKSDFVRTRLTHSIETSSLAKQLTAMITKNISIYEKDTPYKISAAQATLAGDIAMCGGLLHDIGNPPFGHFGEVIIRDWFKNNLAKYSYKDKPLAAMLSPQMKNDLYIFEGNAQALRLVIKLHHIDSDFGLNLTTAVLNTVIKYPADSMRVNEKHANVKNHKIGYYLSEGEEFSKITRATGTKIKNSYCRHPLTFILEAADDIAYATADLEDAFKKGFFSIETFIEFFENELHKYEQHLTKEQIEKSNLLIEKFNELKDQFKNEQSKEILIFQNWISHVRDWLLYSAAYGFTNSYSEIMEGTFKKDIFGESFHGGTIRILKSAMYEFVYSSPGIIKMELGAQSILNALLDKFIPAIIYYAEDCEKNPLHKQTKAKRNLTDLISENYKENYLKSKTDDPVYNLYLRLLLVTDFICGMTDSYAKNLYQELSGLY